MPHSVALVDDHHLVRAGLITTVNDLGDYVVTVEAGHGEELIQALEQAAEPPELAIVDLNMPVMDGWATIAWLHEHRPNILPLALTFDASEEALVRAVRAGARGFLLKNAKPEVLRLALDSIRLTGYFYDDDAHSTLKRNPDRLTPKERERQHVLDALTPRELELIQLICDERELTYEHIAHVMDVQRRTVEGFRSSLFSKFNIKSKTGVVLFAMRWDLLDVKPEELGHGKLGA